VDTRDELLARTLDAAARIKKREDQLRLTRTRVAKCIEVNGGIFENYCELQQICHLHTEIKLKQN
jgi:hypothetical protein